MPLIIWFLPFLSGAMDAGWRIAIKATKIKDLTLIAGGYFFALPFYLVMLYFEGLPEVKPLFWLAVGMHVPLLAAANVLIVKAHRRAPLIKVVAYTSFLPVLLLLTSPLMGGGRPTWPGGLGVIILTFGLYLINVQSDQKDFLAPFRLLCREKAAWMMLGVAVLFSITSNLDYKAMKNANSSFYLLVDHFLVGVLMAVVSFRFYLKNKNQEEKSQYSPRGCYKILALYGMFIAGSVIPHILAFRWIPIVPYVIAAKRAGSILFSVLLGLFMGFIVMHKDFGGERKNLKYRIPGVLITTIGMVVIILWGNA